MDNKKDNNYYINKIVLDLDFIITHSKDVSYDEFCINEILVYSMMFRLIQISENSEKLTEKFKEEHNDIQWRAMKGLRNRIVHEYGAVDLTIIYDTLVKDIPKLKESILSIL